MISLLLASRNAKKLEELRAIMKGLPVRIVSLLEVPGAPEIEEDGKTFSENALKKASELANWSGMLTLGDDSGLCVDALGGAPGVFSARFARHGNDLLNCEKLLKLLQGVSPEKRGAKFCCVIAIAAPGNQMIGMAEGEYRGIIAEDMKGSQGFGYDPLFIDPVTGKRFAELPADQKNKVSHRAIALEKAKGILREYIAKLDEAGEYSEGNQPKLRY